MRASFLPASAHELGKHVFLTAIVVLITVLNVAGASTAARTERAVVGIKLTILLLFVAVGFAGVSPARLAPAQWGPPLSLVAGGMIIFLAYEGFELIANTAEDVADPGPTLTRAYYLSVGFVIILYVLVAVVSSGSVPTRQLVNARDYALAVAARSALGSAGFASVGVAAMLSTASAINATLYGSARMTYTIAKSRELPAQLERPIWNQPLEGLLITAVSTIVLANLLDLASISTMGSAGFPIIFAVVNAAEARTAGERGSAAWISTAAALACTAALAALLARSSPAAAGVLASWSPWRSASKPLLDVSPAPAGGNAHDHPTGRPQSHRRRRGRLQAVRRRPALGPVPRRVHRRHPPSSLRLALHRRVGLPLGSSRLARRPAGPGPQQERYPRPRPGPGPRLRGRSPGETAGHRGRRQPHQDPAADQRAPGCSWSAAAATVGSPACCSARSAPPAPSTLTARSLSSTA
jgi:hypothetical protein